MAVDSVSTVPNTEDVSSNGHYEPSAHDPYKIFVGMPAYQYVTAQALMAATVWPSATPKRCAVPFVIGGSSHCSNFNALWCHALNSRGKYPWTHFLMIHQDVEPERFFVDKLLIEMKEKELDVICVVLPIKDELGMTSVGLLNKKTLSTRRLSMKEIVRYLPTTFTTADLPKLGYKHHVLMPVAGLFLADFTQPWVEKVWFEAPSRILQNVAGEFMAYVWDEGWNFSLQLMQLGVRVGATRIVPTNHLGNGVWGNSEEWGEWDTDASEVFQEWILGRTNT